MPKVYYGKIYIYKILYSIDILKDPKRFGYTSMCIAKENSAPQVKIMPDGLTVTNDKVTMQIILYFDSNLIVGISHGKSIFGSKLWKLVF
jgi:hypothetical protein